MEAWFSGHREAASGDRLLWWNPCLRSGPGRHIQFSYCTGNTTILLLCPFTVT